MEKYQNLYQNKYKNNYEEKLNQILQGNNVKEELENYLEELIALYKINNEDKIDNFKSQLVPRMFSTIFLLTVGFPLFPIIKFLIFIITLISICSTLFSTYILKLLRDKRISILKNKTEKIENLVECNNNEKIENFINDLIDRISKIESNDFLNQRQSFLTNKIRFLNIKKQCNKKNSYSLFMLKILTPIQFLSLAVVPTFLFKTDVIIHLISLLFLEFGVFFVKKQYDYWKSNEFKLYDIKEISELEKELGDVNLLKKLELDASKENDKDKSEEKPFSYHFVPSEDKGLVDDRAVDKTQTTSKPYTRKRNRSFIAD